MNELNKKVETFSISKLECPKCLKVYKTEKGLNNHIKKNICKKKEIYLKPLFKWSGGKSDELIYIKKYIPIKYEIYLEPFIGGGSVYFYINPSKAVISDVHEELIDFYQEIKNGNQSEIYNFLKTVKNDENTYYDIRDNFKIKSSLDNAKRFYYLRKTCFRGMLRYNRKGNFNIPFGRYKTFKFEILKEKKYYELLRNTQIFNKDFSYVFENYNNENNFMFLDPPYDCDFTDYGYCQFGKKEHLKLAEYFKTTKIKCLLVIAKTNFIEELYKDYIVERFSKKYKFKIHSGRVDEKINKEHLIIKNY